MSSANLFRSLALVLGVVVSIVLGGRASVRGAGVATQRTVVSCDAGPYHCAQPSDEGVEAAMAGTSGWYANRVYRSGADEVYLFAAAAPEFSIKDPSVCPKAQGWFVQSIRKADIKTRSGVLPGRQYVLAHMEGNTPKTECAVGLWRRNGRTIQNPIEARFYGLVDTFFEPQPKLIEVSVLSIHYGTYTDNVGQPGGGCFASIDKLLENWSPEEFDGSPTPAR